MPNRSAETVTTGLSLRLWLRLITTMLAILPVVGLLIVALLIKTWSGAHVRLENATQGALHLERLNGLVNTIVMDSRGIYMAADETSAKRHAERMADDINKLRILEERWKKIALAAEENNALEFSSRIQKFIELRTGIIQVFNDRGIASARAFGDTDVARAEQQSLNESLERLEKAYETEVSRLQLKLSDDQQKLIWIAFVVGGAAVCILGVIVSFMRNSFLIPLLDLKQQMLELSTDKIDVDVRGIERGDEIGEMSRAVAVFQDTLLERRKMNREMTLISQFNEWLQSSKSLDELYQMVEEFMTRLLPGWTGSLYVYSNSRDVLDCARSWNTKTTPTTIHADDCWAMRRGRTYAFGDNEIDFKCGHVSGEQSGRYLCIPILAHGETIGLLHLQPASAENDGIIDLKNGASRKLSLSCAEQISLALANVKLRDQLRDQSIRDILTGLYNRRYMLEACRREFSRAARLRQPVAILSLDIDYFKMFNDNHGHDAGDIVLRTVGECLQACFRDDDVACRFGGEEFVVILPGASMDVASRRAEELRERLQSLVVSYMGAPLPRISASIGVAAYPISGDTTQNVLTAADSALYLAKESGRNCVKLATEVQRPERNKLEGLSKFAHPGAATDGCCETPKKPLPANRKTDHTEAANGTKHLAPAADAPFSHEAQA